MESLSQISRTELNQLVADLTPNNEDTENYAKFVINQVFQRLRQECRVLQQSDIDDDEDYEKYSIDRTRIVGSSGKGTALQYFSDYDCVIFVNNRDPENFDEILKDFENVISKIQHDCFIIQSSSIHCTWRSVQFDVTFYNHDNVFHFDLLPAKNMLWKKQTHGLDLALVQGKLTLKHLASIKNPVSTGKLYSSSLCELQVAFVKSHSQFIIAAVRIAKFWNKTIDLVDEDGDSIYVSGRSMLIETIAISAAREVEASTEGLPVNKLYRAFKRFLTLMSNFSTLNVIMADYLAMIGFSTIPEFILKQEPLVLDPVNPWNNLAHYTTVDEDSVNMFEEYATESKQRLKDYKNGHLELSEIFKPQPFGEYEGAICDILFDSSDEDEESEMSDSE